jgi:hypothetical protein
MNTTTTTTAEYHDIDDRYDADKSVRAAYALPDSLDQPEAEAWSLNQATRRLLSIEVTVTDAHRRSSPPLREFIHHIATANAVKRDYKFDGSRFQVARMPSSRSV